MGSGRGQVELTQSQRMHRASRRSRQASAIRPYTCTWRNPALLAAPLTEDRRLISATVEWGIARLFTLMIFLSGPLVHVGKITLMLCFYVDSLLLLSRPKKNKKLPSASHRDGRGRRPIPFSQGYSDTSLETDLEIVSHRGSRISS